MDYNEIFNLIYGFVDMPKPDRDIIKFLSNISIFNGSYMDLTIALGRKVGVNGEQSNIRRAIKRLEDIGIVYINYKDKENKKGGMVDCCLVNNWLQVLTDYYNGKKTNRLNRINEKQYTPSISEEKELIYTALMAYGDKLVDMAKNINDTDVTQIMNNKAEVYINLAQDIIKRG